MWLGVESPKELAEGTAGRDALDGVSGTQIVGGIATDDPTDVTIATGLLRNY